jgi:hypothetical protein
MAMARHMGGVVHADADRVHRASATLALYFSRKILLLGWLMVAK